MQSLTTKSISPWRSIGYVLLIIFLQWSIYLIVSRLGAWFGMYPQGTQQRDIFFSISILLGMPLGIGILYWTIHYRGLDVKAYLGLRAFSFGQVLTVLLCCMAFVAAITERNGIAMAELIFFPIFVEILIRGFLYQGLLQTSYGARLAIPISTLVWLIVYGIIFVAVAMGPLGMWRMDCLDCPSRSSWLMSLIVLIPIVLGLVLAIIRHVTKSLYPTIAIMLALSLLSQVNPLFGLWMGVGKDAVYVFYSIPEFFIWFVSIH